MESIPGLRSSHFSGTWQATPAFFPEKSCGWRAWRAVVHRVAGSGIGWARSVIQSLPYCPRLSGITDLHCLMFSVLNTSVLHICLIFLLFLPGIYHSCYSKLVRSEIPIPPSEFSITLEHPLLLTTVQKFLPFSGCFFKKGGHEVGMEAKYNSDKRYLWCCSVSLEAQVLSEVCKSMGYRFRARNRSATIEHIGDVQSFLWQLVCDNISFLVQGSVWMWCWILSISKCLYSCPYSPFLERRTIFLKSHYLLSKR